MESLEDKASNLAVGVGSNVKDFTVEYAQLDERLSDIKKILALNFTDRQIKLLNELIQNIEYVKNGNQIKVSPNKLEIKMNPCGSFLVKNFRRDRKHRDCSEKVWYPMEMLGSQISLIMKKIV